VTRYLLDTNIVSDATRPQPSQGVADWFTRQINTDLFISTLTLAEIWRGILEKPAGRKRRDLESWFDGTDGPRTLFRGRILPFDEAAGLEWASIMAGGKRAGRSRAALDMIIASTAIANECVVVTLNDRHFAGVVETLNPQYVIG
jgi:toxin FitB